MVKKTFAVTTMLLASAGKLAAGDVQISGNSFSGSSGGVSLSVDASCEGRECPIEGMVFGANPEHESPPPPGPHAVDSFSVKKWIMLPSNYVFKRSRCEGTELAGSHPICDDDATTCSVSCPSGPPCHCGKALAMYERDHGHVMTFRESIISALNGTSDGVFDATTGLPLANPAIWPIMGRGTTTTGVAEARDPACGDSSRGYGRMGYDGGYENTDIPVTGGIIVDTSSDSNKGDFLYDPVNKNMLGIPHLIEMEFYVPSKRPKETAVPESIFEASYKFSFDDWLLGWAGAKTTDASDPDSFISKIMDYDTSEEAAQLINNEWFGGAANIYHITPSGYGLQYYMNDVYRNTYGGRYNVATKVQNILKGFLWNSTNIPAYDFFVTKFQTTSTYANIMQKKRYQKRYINSIVMDTNTKLWGTTYDPAHPVNGMNADANNAVVGSNGASAYVNRESKLPIYFGTETPHMCDDLASRGMICAVINGHYAGGTVDPLYENDYHIKNLHIKDIKYIDNGHYDDFEISANAYLAHYTGYNSGNYKSFFDNYYNVATRTKCRYLKNGEDGSVLETQMGQDSLEYSIKLMAEFEQMILDSPVGPYVDKTNAGTGGYSGNGQLVNAAYTSGQILLPSNELLKYRFVGELQFTYRAGLHLDGTLDGDALPKTISNMKMDPWEFGHAEGSAMGGFFSGINHKLRMSESADKKCERGNPRTDMIPWENGFTFPTMFLIPHGDTYGAHQWKGAEMGVAPAIFLQDLFYRTAYQRTDAAKFTIQESYLYEYGANHNSQGSMWWHGSNRYALHGGFAETLYQGNEPEVWGSLGFPEVKKGAYNPASPEFAMRGVHEARVSDQYRNVHGMGSFVARHLMNNHPVTQSTIEEQMVGDIVRAPVELPFAARLKTDLVVTESISMPPLVRISPDMKAAPFDSDLWFVTPDRQIMTINASEPKMLGEPFEFTLYNNELLNLESIRIQLRDTKPASQGSFKNLPVGADLDSFMSNDSLPINQFDENYDTIPRPGGYTTDPILFDGSGIKLELFAINLEYQIDGSTSTYDATTRWVVRQRTSQHNAPWFSGGENRTVFQAGADLDDGYGEYGYDNDNVITNPPYDHGTIGMKITPPDSTMAGLLKFTVEVASECWSNGCYDFARIYKNVVPDKYGPLRAEALYEIAGFQTVNYEFRVEPGDFFTVVYEKDSTYGTFIDSMFVSDIEFSVFDPSTLPEISPNCSNPADPHTCTQPRVDILLDDGVTLLAQLGSGDNQTSDYFTSDIPTSWSTLKYRVHENVFESGLIKITTRTTPRVTKATRSSSSSLSDAFRDSISQVYHRDNTVAEYMTTRPQW